jgi:hypothetical protein
MPVITNTPNTDSLIIELRSNPAGKTWGVLGIFFSIVAVFSVFILFMGDLITLTRPVMIYVGLFLSVLIIAALNIYSRLISKQKLRLEIAGDSFSLSDIVSSKNVINCRVSDLELNHKEWRAGLREYQYYGMALEIKAREYKKIVLGCYTSKRFKETNNVLFNGVSSVDFILEKDDWEKPIKKIELAKNSVR